MRRSSFSPEPDCAIAQSLAVIGDGWDLLIVRDLARGVDRFDQLADSLHISRKVLTEQLNHLLESGIVERSPYQQRPTQYAYRLTTRCRALLPVLVALQDWGDRWLLGDGTLSGTNTSDDPPAQATVVFGYPATNLSLPGIPAAHGCTLENRLFRDRSTDFVAAGISVHGVSTQRPDEQRDFAHREDLPHALLSDVGRTLIAALRLPTFRVADTERLKRFVLVSGPDRVVRAVRYPVTDLADAVDWAYTTAAR